MTARNAMPSGDILLAERMIARIHALYGAPCPTLDTDDHEMPRGLNAAGRCPCCAANEVVVWLRDSFIANAIEEESRR